MTSVLLALESSGPVGSVAVAEGGEVVARAWIEDRNRQVARMVPAVAETLDAAGRGRRDVAGVVVGAGPGSFTGVRVAAATGKGLAHALGVPLWAFSSLEAAAVADLALPGGAWPPDPRLSPPPDLSDLGGGPDPSAPRWVLFDARGDRVFAGRYRPAPDGVETLVEPAPARLGEILRATGGEGAAFVGDAAVRHRKAIREAGHRPFPAPSGVPTADGLLWLRARTDAAPLADPARWEPDYLKASSAERARGLG